MHNYAYSSCNLFTSFNITTYLILIVVYGFYLLLLCHRSRMFLGVVETVVGSCLCCDMDIVQCLFSFLYYIISWLPPSAISRNYPDLREGFHSFPSSDFLVVFSYSFALEKRFSANVCKSGNYKGHKHKISDSQSESSKTFYLSCHRCICCGSILSLVLILFPFVFGYGNAW